MKRWTPELDEPLRKILAEGMSALTAARRLKFSRATIQVQIKRLGLNTFRPMSEEEKQKVLTLHQEKKTDLQIAVAIGRSVATVHKWRWTMGLKPNFKGVQLRVSEEQETEIERMNRAGKTDTQIAALLKMSASKVRRVREGIGLKMVRLKKVTQGGCRKAHTIAELMRPTRFKPGTSERANVESQREANGLRNHPLDAN